MKKFTDNINVAVELAELKKHSAEYWQKKHDALSIDLFRFASTMVPAYRIFLQKNGIKPQTIKTLEDFKKLPLVSKDNYLLKHDYKELFPKKELHKVITYSATSGSTGEPFYFPRLEVHDQKYELAAQLFFENQFDTKKKTTLVLVGFGFGIWIGGMMTYHVLYQMAASGHKLSIVPTGPNKEQFISAFKKFAGYYDQVILAGYPPFIKDILDEGEDYGIDWKKHKLKIFTAAEGYSEKFREYIAQKAGLKNYFSDIVNLYGTVELGVNGHETTLSSLIRHLTVKDKKLFKELFPKAENTPTLAQYYPQFIHLEEIEIDGQTEIVGTGYGTHIPLIRYRFKDLGGVIPYQVMMEKLSACGIDIKKEMKLHDLDPNKIVKLPFVYVYARSDFTVSLYGIVLYPEYFRDVLPNKELAGSITDRFSMAVHHDNTQNQFLEINVELKKGLKSNQDLIEKIKKFAVDALLKHSTEYNHLYNSSPTYAQRLMPKIVLWPHNHPLYFARTGKQAWVKKS